MVIRDRCDAAAHNGVGEGFHWHLRWVHSADKSLETFVCEGRLTTILFNDPEIMEMVN